MYDGELNSVWSTTALREELGYGYRDLTSEENFSFVHPDDLERVRGNLERLHAGEPAVGERFRARAADGEFRWLSTISTDLLDDERVGQIVTHVWDISEQVAQEAEIDAFNEMLRALIDTLDEAVIVVSDDVIQFANARVAELVPGIDDHQALAGRPVQEFAATFMEAMADPAGFEESARQIAAESRPVRGNLVELASGVICEQHFLPIYSRGRVVSRMWVYRDVSAQLEVERRQHQVLELERDTRHALERQNARLRQVDELKTAFVATVSHELRTPLASLRSYLDLLMDPAGGELNDEQQEIASAALRGAVKLGRLVDDLLVLAQLQSDTLQIERSLFDVGEVLGDVVAEFAPGVPEGVELASEIDPGPRLDSDPLRVSQIVSNVLGNALKFADSRVSCSARSSIACGWLRSSTTGRVSRPMTWSGSSSRSTVAARGRASATRGPDSASGSRSNSRPCWTHSSRSRMQTCAARGSRSRSRSRVEGAQMADANTVLVIEDDAELRRALELTFGRAGLRPTLCADGRSGLRAHFDLRPAVVVLDIGLPDIDGWEVLERIRDVSDVPVLAAHRAQPRVRQGPRAPCGSRRLSDEAVWERGAAGADSDADEAPARRPA